MKNLLTSPITSMQRLANKENRLRWYSSTLLILPRALALTGQIEYPMGLRTYSSSSSSGGQTTLPDFFPSRGIPSTFCRVCVGVSFTLGIPMGCHLKFPHDLILRLSLKSKVAWQLNQHAQSELTTILHCHGFFFFPFVPYGSSKRGALYTRPYNVENKASRPLCQSRCYCSSS